MRIGIFGGSFNPVHNGHIVTAEFAAKARNLNKIILIPAFISPLKPYQKYADASQRIEMLNLAVKKKPLFEISDFEIKKGGISYTIDTINYFKNLYPEIDLIIGMDNLIQFEMWKNPDELIEKVNLVVLLRESDGDIIKNKYFEHAIFLNSPKIDISSSGIREKLLNLEPITGLVPSEVEKYIIKNNLYRT